MARNKGGQLGNGNATTHGLHRMKLMLKELGTTPIDGRSAISVALRNYAEELAADLGGSPRRPRRRLSTYAAGKRFCWIRSILGFSITRP